MYSTPYIVLIIVFHFWAHVHSESTLYLCMYFTNIARKHTAAWSLPQLDWSHQALLWDEHNGITVSYIHLTTRLAAIHVTTYNVHSRQRTGYLLSKSLGSNVLLSTVAEPQFLGSCLGACSGTLCDLAPLFGCEYLQWWCLLDRKRCFSHLTVHAFLFFNTFAAMNESFQTYLGTVPYIDSARVQRITICFLL